MKDCGDTKDNAIIFDVGGVLSLNKNSIFINKRGHKNLGVHNDISKKLKISLDQWFDSIDSVYSKSIEGKISRIKALSIISRNTETPRRKIMNLFVQEYKKNYKQNKRLYKLALKFKRQGYKIAILSDQWYLSSEALIPKKYYDDFKPAIVSCNVGMRKPNLQIYKYTLKRLRLNPSQTIFIDNQEWNIKPAKSIGMNTILFKDNNQAIKELKKFGVLR